MFCTFEAKLAKGTPKPRHQNSELGTTDVLKNHAIIHTDTGSQKNDTIYDFTVPILRSGDFKSLLGADQLLSI